MKLTVFPILLISVCWVLVQAKVQKRCPKRLLCGTNGITYRSRCELADALLEDPDIEIQFLGSCMEYRKQRIPQRKIHRLKASYRPGISNSHKKRREKSAIIVVMSQ